MRFHIAAEWGVFRLRSRALSTFAALALLACGGSGSGSDNGTGGAPAGSGGMSGETSTTGGTMGASGGTSGTGGTGGTSLMLQGPVERAGQLVLEFGDTYLSIDPAHGGRVLSLRQAGRELLLPASENPDNFGSTYWTSPQSDWGWPPIAAIDTDAYSVVVDGPTVTLVSAQADVGPQAGGKHVKLTKRFAANLARETIDIEYTLENVGSSPVSLASWEISRVPPGGFTFYPTGSSEQTPINPPHPGVVPVTHESNVTWFDHAQFVTGQNAKLNADGAGGWLAHVESGVLFLKTFDDVAPANQAPGEGQIEVFVDGAGAYVEVENQGPYISIDPGATSTYKMSWLVRRLPPSVQVAPGSASLLAFVQSLLP